MSSLTKEEIKQQFPLHWLVWHNNVEELKALLASESAQFNLEKADPHGRTALMLSVVLGYTSCARLLLQANADANTQGKQGFSIVHEATCRADPDLLYLVQQYRDYQRFTKREAAIPTLLEALKESPDFYVEMKWELSSWIPLVSNFCPTDTYKVYKSGSEVRIDTTLLGFDNMKWLRGSRSYIFKGRKDHAIFMEVNHDERVVYRERIAVMAQASDQLEMMRPTSEEIRVRLQSPVVSNYIDIDNVEFERNKSGLWGWRTEKSESVNGYEAKVYTASNVRFVTVTRSEHLSPDDKKRSQTTGGGGGGGSSSTASLEAFFRMTDSTSNTSTRPGDKLEGGTQRESQASGDDENKISIEQYFSPSSSSSSSPQDCGRGREQQTKTDTFRATLWLCQDYPLSLQEQVLPVIDLMASTSAHFAKLRDFITLQLPAGFPVKVDIPLYHVLTTKVTFGNIHASDTPVHGVTLINEASDSATGKMMCVLDDTCFDVPSGYRVVGLDESSHQRSRGGADDEERLLQMAIEQSLIQAGTEDEQVTVWEALNTDHSPGSTPASTISTSTTSTTSTTTQNQSALLSNHFYSEESLLLQRVIEESLRMSTSTAPATDTTVPTPAEARAGEEAVAAGAETGEAEVTTGEAEVVETWTEASEVGEAGPRAEAYEDDIAIALRLSQQEERENETRRRQEAEELERILQLSLTEK